MGYWFEGLLNDSTEDSNTENRSLWTVEYILLHALTDSSDEDKSSEQSRVLIALLNLQDAQNIWHSLPDHSRLIEEGFSRDNMIAITSFGKLINNQRLAYAGNDAFWDKHYWQPQDKIYFAWCAKRWWAYPLLPILAISILVAMFSLSRTGEGKLDTDGRLLTLVRCLPNLNSVFFRILWKIGCWISKKRLSSYLKSYPEQMPIQLSVNAVWSDISKYHWQILFRMYFQEPKHPINCLLTSELVI